MAIKKVWIVEEECTACGLCAETCPEIFEVDDTARVKEDDFNAYEEAIREAAESCPVEAIKIEEE